MRFMAEYVNRRDQETTKEKSNLKNKNLNIGLDGKASNRKAAIGTKKAITELFRRECRIP